jgi:hypothetical protein
MAAPETAAEVADVAQKAISTSSLIAHIVERRIEYLVGTLIAYQIGILDQLVATGSQCIA